MSGRRQFEDSEIAVPGAPPEFAQRHYSVIELAQLWQLSPDTLRGIFEREPGVVVIEPVNGGKYSKRRYRTLRIPEAVAARVHARLSKSA